MMSSPISNLKKVKKSLLGKSTSQNHNVPYRHDDDSLLEEVTTRMSNKKYPLTSSRQGFSSTNAVSSPTDLDLMQTMISRMAILEKQAQIQSRQLLGKDKRISVLEDKCRLYQKLQAEEAHSPRYVTDLESRCLFYQQQISEMEDFLMDYGMVWVGQKDDDDDLDDDTQTQTPGGMWDHSKSVAGEQHSQPSATHRYNIDFDRILENIKELNIIAGDGQSKIEKTKSGARFKVPEPVRLILYNNGIVMFDGPFRSYEEKSTQICIADLMDGYFPTELQYRYPDGVPFNVRDKRGVTFEPKQAVKVFTGQGQSVGGDTLPSRLIPSIVNPSTDKHVLTESSLPGPKLSADQFLSHLPTSVVRSGRVIDIRSSLTDTLKGSDSNAKPCPVTVVETETMQEIKGRLEIEESVRPPSGKNITTLRIKDTDNHTYVLKMKFSDTIGDVMNYLSELRTGGGSNYQLLTAFPSKVYSDLTETLFNAGLTPNASMHIRTQQ